jgi:aminoglycoside phosphotransferase (APT) family kinase protein
MGIAPRQSLRMEQVLPVTEEDISRFLLDYLRSATACPVLAYAEAPTRMSGGYDATILRFSLQSAPDPFSGPLVLRLFQATASAQRAPREAAVQNALAELGYPAPRVFIAEARIEPLGGPFLIMELMPGRPLGSEFEEGLGQTLHILRQLPRIRREVLRLWDEAQTRLQALPVSDFVDRVERAGFSGETFTFDSYFASLRASAEELGLNELRPAIDWLIVHRPRRSQTPVICHGDFQPLNILADYGRLTGVIDLGESDDRRSRLRLRSGARHSCDRADSRPVRIASNVTRANEQSGAHTFASLSIFTGK